MGLPPPGAAFALLSMLGCPYQGTVGEEEALGPAQGPLLTSASQNLYHGSPAPLLVPKGNGLAPPHCVQGTREHSRPPPREDTLLR
jgi:hypothetical protein